MDLHAMKLNTGEQWEVEDLAGQPLDWLEDPNRPKRKLFAAIATVIKQRTDPSYTMEQASQLDIIQIFELLGITEDDLMAIADGKTPKGLKAPQDRKPSSKKKTTTKKSSSTRTKKK